MQLQFTKEIVYPNNPLYQGFLENDRLYRIIDGGKRIGNFLCSGNSAHFEFAGLKYSIVINKKFWGNSEYKILDGTNSEIGEYFIPVTKAFNNLGSLKINNSLFSFENLNNPKDFHIFKPATWKNVNNKQYSLKLSDCINDVIYTLEIHSKKFRDFSSAEFSEATGSIEFTGRDLLLVFAGFFLIEQFFNDLDDSSN